MKYSIIPLFLALCLITLTLMPIPLANALTPNIASNEFNAVLDPYLENPPNNYEIINDIDKIPTGWGNWNKDFETIPQGIYLGQTIAPQIIDTGLRQKYTPTFIEIESQVIFTSNEILNGCSDFWFMLPIFFDPAIINQSFLEYSFFYFNDNWTYANEIYYNNNHIYARFNFIILPDLEYNIRARIPLVYWTIPDIQTKGFYGENTLKMLITAENVGNSTSYENNYKFLTAETEADYFNSYADYQGFSSISIIQLPKNITFGYSFIFIRGIGQGGFFGKTYPIREKAAVPIGNVSQFSFNAYMDFDPAMPDRYVSIKIPFDSINELYVYSITFFIDKNFPIGLFYAGPGDLRVSNTFLSQSTYKDFIIASSTIPFTANNSYPPGVYPIVIQILVSSNNNMPGSIGLLHNINDNITSRVMGYRYDQNSDFKLMYFDITNYGSFTTGQWAYIITDQKTGDLLYTKAFQTKIYVPVHIYEVVIENPDGSTTTIYAGQDRLEYEAISGQYQVLGYDDDQGSMSDMAKFLLLVCKASYTGLNSLYGFIRDSFQVIYDTLLIIGEITVNAVISLNQLIRSISAFLEENLLSILELMFLSIGPTIALFMLVYISRPLKNAVYGGAKNEV